MNPRCQRSFNNFRKYILLYYVVIASAALVSGKPSSQRQPSSNPCVSKVCNGDIKTAVADFQKSKCGKNVTHILSNVISQYEKSDQIVNLVEFVEQLGFYNLSKAAGVHTNVDCTYENFRRFHFGGFMDAAIQAWEENNRRNVTNNFLNFAQIQSMQFNVKQTNGIASTDSGDAGPKINCEVLRPYIDQIVERLETLYTLLEDHLVLNSTSLLTFNHKVGTVAEEDTDLAKIVYWRLADLRQKLAPHCDQVITSWTSQIRADNGDNMINFAKRNPATFRYHMKLLVHKLYGLYPNYATATSFIRALPYVEDYIVGFQCLQHEMAQINQFHSSELMMLAYAVRNVTQLPSYEKIGEKYRIMVESLKHKFPKGVISIMWSNRNNCTIMNSHYKQYLYLAGESSWNRGLLWVPGDIDSDCFWRLQFLRDGEEVLMQNTYRGRILNTGYANFDRERDYVGSWRINLEQASSNMYSETHWRIIPDGDKFRIKSSSGDMYASGHHLDNKRRWALIWKHKRELPRIVKQTRQWEIVCYD